MLRARPTRVNGAALTGSRAVRPDGRMAAMLRRDFVKTAALAALGAAAVPRQSAATAPAGGSVSSHGLSMYGDLKYGRDFRHLDYVDPRAPRGGQVRLSAIGTFDTLNPFVIKGVPAAGIGGVFETLLTPALDEASAEYGLIAETVEVPADRAWVQFTLRPGARFHDGSRVTVEDVMWSFDTLRARGRPFFRSY